MLNKKSFLVNMFLALAIIESAVTFFYIASIPADLKNALYFGFSLSRLLMLASIGLLFLFAIVLLGIILFSNTGKEKILSIVDETINHKKYALIFLGIALVFCVSVLTLLIPIEKIGVSIFQRLLPIILLIIFLSAQSLILRFVWLKRKIHWQELSQWRQIYISASIALTIFFLIGLFTIFSGIGIVPEKTGWFPPGTPILAGQVLLALTIGFLFFLISEKFEWQKYHRLDFAIGIVLWLLAGFIWLNEPLQELSYFTTAPTPPNFESYPYSDAALYDTFAQNYLIGASLKAGLTHRPLYSIFLAFLHALAGQNYHAMILIQVFLLATAPAFLYGLTSELGGRAAGILAGLMLIFREQNAIALTNVIEVSHSKLLMSDVPTMALTILFIYFLVKWFQTENIKSGVLAGVCLGFTILTRSQAQLLIPIVLVYLLFKKESWKNIFWQACLFLLGVLVVVAPWVWRNYQVSGRVLVEYQNFYTTIIASGYTDNPDDIVKLPNESLEVYNDRMIDLIIKYMRENPMEVARFYTAYFLHNEISSVIYFPMSPQFLEAKQYVRELGLWGWNPVFGSPPTNVLPLFFITLLLIAFGIGCAYQKLKWIGLMPLLLHLGYSLSVVPFKASGWRFILPVDWVLTLYFSLGLMQVAFMVFALFHQSSGNMGKENLITKNQNPLQYKKALPVLVIFLLIGLSFPIAERMIPAKYPPLSENEIKTYIAKDVVLDNGEVLSASALENFLETESNSVVVRGSALYPSFYETGEFWGDDDSYPLEIRNISRLQFLLIGALQRNIYLPMNAAPEFFPHGAEVLVIGCQTDVGVRALAVKINSETTFVSELPWRGLTCSVP